MQAPPSSLMAAQSLTRRAAFPPADMHSAAPLMPGRLMPQEQPPRLLDGAALAAQPYFPTLPCPMWCTPYAMAPCEFLVHAAAPLTFACPCALHSSERVVRWKKSGPRTLVRAQEQVPLGGAGSPAAQCWQQIGVGYCIKSRGSEVKLFVVRIIYFEVPGEGGPASAPALLPWHYVQLLACPVPGQPPPGQAPLLAAPHHDARPPSSAREGAADGAWAPRRGAPRAPR